MYSKPEIIARPHSRAESATYGALGIALVMGFWWLLTESAVFQFRLIPGPVEVFRAGLGLGPSLGSHFLSTLARVVVGFIVGWLFGVLGGLALSYSRVLLLWFGGVVDAMRPVPPVALVPFFILIFGFSETARIVLVVLGTGLVVLVAFLEACRESSVPLSDALRTLGYGKLDIYRLVVVPHALSRLLGPTRVALALSVSLVVVSEFMGAQRGLGYLLNVARVTTNTSVILVSTSLLGVIAGGLDTILRRLFLLLTVWDRRIADNP